MNAVFNAKILVSPCFKKLCNLVDTANCRNDPDGVSDSNVTILSFISLNGRNAGGGIHSLLCIHLHYAFFGFFCVISIFSFFTESSLNVESMYPITLLDGTFCLSDRITVLDDTLTFCNILKGYFVSCRDICSDCESRILNFDYTSLWQ